MTKSAAVSKVLRSKGLIVALLLGNVALGFTIVVQDQIIQGQSHLIHLLFQDAAELTSYRVAFNALKAKKH